MNHIAFQCIITTMKKFFRSFLKVFFVLLLLLILASCNQPRQFGVTPTNDGNVTVATEIFAEATDTEIAKTITATMTPLAMKVNDFGYPLEDFKQDLLRFMMVFPEKNPQEAFDMLSSDLSEQLILQQAAINNGFVLSQEELEQRIATLVEEIGGNDMLNNWMSNNYYSQSSFRSTLEREMAIAYQKQIILETIPDEIEQTELYQILVYDESSAKQIGQALEEGTDFFWLAQQYHPATLGYIGWNPQGAMLPAEVEEIAFSMEVGTHSEIIQTDYGYHILYLNNKETHKLSPENLLYLQEAALTSWMETEKQNAIIEIYATYDE